MIATERYIAADGVERSRSSTSRCRRWSTRSRRWRTRSSSATTRRRRPTTSGTGRPATRRPPTRCSPRRRGQVKQNIYLPRIHVASIETCGMVADYDKISGKLHDLHDLAGAARAPHRVRAGQRACPEQKIQIISPDIGGGFGGKVPVYPGYVCCAVASLVSPASRSSGSRIAARTCRPTRSRATITSPPRWPPTRTARSPACA